MRGQKLGLFLVCRIFSNFDSLQQQVKIDKSRQRDCATREQQQSEAEELDNNKSHNKARQMNWTTKSQQGKTGELGNDSPNKSRQRSCTTRRATTSRGRGTGQQLEQQKFDLEELCHIEIHIIKRGRETGQQSHSTARQENWSTSRATTSRGRGAVPQREPQQVKEEGLSHNESHNKARQRS